ncbi:MAG: hypothetical protein ACMV0J_05670 [Fluviibacter sp.]
MPLIIIAIVGPIIAIWVIYKLVKFFFKLGEEVVITEKANKAEDAYLKSLDDQSNQPK